MLKCEKLKIVKEGQVYVDIDFTLKDSLALVGESGSGKSLTLKALLELLPQGFKSEIALQSEFAFKKGENTAFVPQNPFTALSPMTKIKDQFFCEDAKEKLAQVNLDAKILERFPLELSGGEIQRVIIAMSLLKNLKLILLDEPTTALDFKNRENIITLLKELQQRIGFLILFVSHDIKSASRLCNEIAVIQKGEIIEYGDMVQVIQNPQQEYTQKLKSSHFGYREFRC